MTVPIRAAKMLDLSVELLNHIFTPLTYEERIRALYHYFSEEEVLVTSSFGTKSVFLLHLIRQACPEQVIHFIDTTYHFPETIAYKEQLTELLDLRVIDVLPGRAENKLTRDEQWWRSHPRMCCSINKIAPLEPVKDQHLVWISGLMAYQTAFRSRLRVFEKQGDIIKFHPLIDIEEQEFRRQLQANRLPRHPLEDRGYGSIGCVHCTKQGENREGRWQGTNQTECGLHPAYFVRRNNPA